MRTLILIIAAGVQKDRFNLRWSGSIKFPQLDLSSAARLGGFLGKYQDGWIMPSDLLDLLPLVRPVQAKIAMVNAPQVLEQCCPSFPGIYSDFQVGAGGQSKTCLPEHLELDPCQFLVPQVNGVGNPSPGFHHPVHVAVEICFELKRNMFDDRNGKTKSK